LDYLEFDTCALDVSKPEERLSTDLSSFGYSNVNHSNSLSILKKLEDLDLGSNKLPTSTPRRERTISLSRAAAEVYKSVLAELPCPTCVNVLVKIFFDEVNWQYTILDPNCFNPKLEQFYSQSPVQLPNLYTDTTSSDKLIFAALLFQTLACAAQFLPSGFSEKLHASCMTSITVDEDSLAETPTIRLLNLLPKNVITLDYIATQILRTAWLKNRGLVAEAWLTVAQAVINAQEIGLHQDDGKLYASEAESAIEELWHIVSRRRLMLILFIWDA
jgi:hypothetical protein